MPLMRRFAALGAALAAARRYARQNPDTVNRYTDQAARFVDQKTGGKYRSQIDSAVRQVRKQTSIPGQHGVGPSGGGPSGGAQQDGGPAPHGGQGPRQQYPSYREDRPTDRR